MNKNIMVYDNDVVCFGDNKFCYSSDRYKYGRSYDIVEDIEEISDIIANTPEEIINIAEMKEKEGYIIGECSHSNGYTTDFIMKIGTHIYVCSYVDGYRCEGIDVSICYNIETSEFEMDSDEYAIVSEEDEKFISEYADRYY